MSARAALSLPVAAMTATVDGDAVDPTPSGLPEATVAPPAETGTVVDAAAPTAATGVVLAAAADGIVVWAAAVVVSADAVVV
jgi:hypothetical protein